MVEIASCGTNRFDYHDATMLGPIKLKTCKFSRQPQDNYFKMTFAQSNELESLGHLYKKHDISQGCQC